jgi:hypothetical protein
MMRLVLKKGCLESREMADEGEARLWPCHVLELLKEAAGSS